MALERSRSFHVKQSGHPPTVLVEISGEFRYTGHAYQHCGDKGGHAMSVAGDGFSAEEGGVSS